MIAKEMSYEALRTQFKKNLRGLLSQRGMAARIGKIGKLPKTSISTWQSETRTSIPDIIDGVRLANALGVTAEYLVLGENASLSLKDRYLLDLARRYESVLDDLKDLDDTSFQTFATSIHAVAEEARARKKMIGG